ncbi:MFS transporter, partial [Pseudoalteromonas sp. S554]|uniref:MFS transporter n=1 Tax=Pseudoalteromonas sp. S554 TaxID=2066516 RepID=UPI00110CB5CA
MICSSLNLLRFISVRLLRVGLYSKSVTFQGSTSPAIAAEFGTSPQEAGSIATVSQLGYALGIVLVVPLGDRNEPRSLVRYLLAGVALALFAASFSPSLGVLATLSFVICMGTCVPQIVLPLAAGLTRPERRGRVIAAVQTGLVLGILFSRMLAGIGANSLRWRNVYLIASILMVISAVILPVILPRRRSAIKPIPYLSLISSLLHLFGRERDLRLSCLLGAVVFAAFSAFWTTISFKLAQAPFNFDLAETGLFALWGGIGGLASLLAGGLIDRFGYDRVNAFSIALTAFSFIIVLALRDSYIALVVGANLVSFSLWGSRDF